jgi:hypothetical protein
VSRRIYAYMSASGKLLFQREHSGALPDYFWEDARFGYRMEGGTEGGLIRLYVLPSGPAAGDEWPSGPLITGYGASYLNSIYNWPDYGSNIGIAVMNTAGAGAPLPVEAWIDGPDAPDYEVPPPVLHPTSQYTLTWAEDLGRPAETSAWPEPLPSKDFISSAWVEDGPDLWTGTVAVAMEVWDSIGAEVTRYFDIGVHVGDAIYDRRHRRTYPREDGLAGGAPRNYPRPRSEQRGNRLGGSYL